jgi:predicted dehydrogenase/threonine dehydrogenase-like Zn-dependent dehydrogenase
VKQVIQNLNSGGLLVTDVPAPAVREEGILVRTHVSLISAGTERMMLKLAGKGLLGKARERPDLVKKVFDKFRRDGFFATFQAVRQQLDREVPVGYSVTGEVVAVGEKVQTFSVGQKVACAGAGYANHAEVNYVPHLLAAAVPASVSDEAAAYATVGAIALQGVRNADVRVGETVAVIGLGLLGQLAVQILRASGCRVIGLDLSEQRVQLAARHGAELALVARDGDIEKRASAFSRGHGADAVLITAATSSNAPVQLAARLARDRARIVMVGVTGMQIPRKPYYEKELTFIVSRSYGPGRYDRQYEEHGSDYPIGYVRWTENRNLEAFLDLVAARGVRPEVCTTHRFPIAEAEAAFELILTNREPYLGVVLTYPSEADGSTAETNKILLRPPADRKPIDNVGVSFVGAGSFARSVHLPNLAKLAAVKLPAVELRGIVDGSGIAARSAGRKFGFAFCASDETEILGDPETDVIFIATPHSQHAQGVCRALEAGKSVFVEKPLAISLDQLRQICETLQSHPGHLMVGFNRRFAPLAAELKRFVSGRGPLAITYRCNAGPVAADHWISDPAEGGRIIGEACHFFDFFAYLTDASPETVFAAAPSSCSADDALITVTYADGSVCHLLYTAQGPGSFGKERVEVFAGGRVGVLEDFRRLELRGDDGRCRRQKRLRADKGHAAELGAFTDAVRTGGDLPIGIESLFDTTLTSLAAVNSARQHKPIRLSECAPSLRDTTVSMSETPGRRA